ncbi:MAG TPA: 16S rRNA (cytosine(1402)-N(4))-methyltransferase RsmH [Hellea balneolensis]|uniref:Ribosomal RNA small subunit methyltransferase H n=1 Tax=Hellea balneolensis TaxID=287478 RepID=A0A7C5LRD9_9PROT|nr:16S rRNA (cytosine(1402)-N(4))-methyltransferase RsmH [Hellea balneolensis]
MNHIPVLLNEVLGALAPGDGEIYIDGTFGAGGYSRAIMAAANCRVVALDRDPHVKPHALILQKEFGSRFSFSETEFSKLDQVTNGKKVDGVVLDIGVSSMQLDQAERGFSFQKSGPLDMRMSGDGVSAADVVAHFTHSELVRVFKVYGDEKRAKRCADFIVRERETAPIITTDSLAEVVSAALGRSGKRHPATRVFQALRIYVNDELGELYRALLAAERILRPGGRLVVVTFHSLEDRLVKSFFNQRTGKKSSSSRYVPESPDQGPSATFTSRGKQGKSASDAEIKANPRARSARIRYGIRTEASAYEGEIPVIPGLPNLDEFSRRVA